MTAIDSKMNVIAFTAPLAIIALSFGIGLWSTISSTPMPSKVEVTPEPALEEVLNPLLTSELTYIEIHNAITSTIPGLEGTVQVETALMMRAGISKSVAEIAQQNPSAMVAVMSDAIDQAQANAFDLGGLREQLPEMFKAALNEYLGTESTPDPVQEVLITKLNISQ